MADSPKSLDDLRVEIDRLDAEMHDLLMRRAEISRAMGGAKGGTPTMRPAREMEILRRLAARHRGDLPLASVMRIWREIMAASLALQGDFKVYLVGADDPRFWGMARFHFGSATQAVSCGSPVEVVRRAAESVADIGILPAPAFEEDEPWWPHLLYAEAGGPRVIAKLPVLAGAPGYDFPAAYAVANVTQRPTGEDASLIAALTGPDFSRAKAGALFKDHGIEVQLMALAPDTGVGGRRHMLFETSRFIAEDDPALTQITETSKDILQLKVTGGYARPIDYAAVIAGDGG